jgi:hypothetical protein
VHGGGSGRGGVDIDGRSELVAEDEAAEGAAGLDELWW